MANDVPFYARNTTFFEEALTTTAELLVPTSESRIGITYIRNHSVTATETVLVANNEAFTGAEQLTIQIGTANLISDVTIYGNGPIWVKAGAGTPTISGYYV